MEKQTIKPKIHIKPEKTAYNQSNPEQNETGKIIIQDYRGRVIKTV